MSIWQTKSWQQMLKKSGQVSDFFEIPFSENKGKIYVEERSLGLGEYGLFVIGLEKKLNKKDVNELINLCKKQNCLFIQIESINYSSHLDSSKVASSSGEEQKILSFLGEDWDKNYYKKFITPYTAVIELTKSEEEILANMKPKGRYNIKLAKKKGVIAEIVEKTEENIRAYYDLMLETTARDGFAGNSFEYYKIFLESLENSRLILAKKDGVVIAGGIFIFDKDVSIYYYGASTSKKEYRNLMAPYLVQWEAITYAKSIGSKIYDFLGVASPEDKNSSLAGVTDFKKKLTKDIRKVSESYIYINKKIKYLIINTLRKLKK